VFEYLVEWDAGYSGENLYSKIEFIIICKNVKRSIVLKSCMRKVSINIIKLMKAQHLFILKIKTAKAVTFTLTNIF
jgi:hypothetical protein